MLSVCSYYERLTGVNTLGHCLAGKDHWLSMACARDESSDRSIFCEVLSAMTIEFPTLVGLKIQTVPSLNTRAIF